ncbi:carboxypeptidase M32 [Brevibacillus sp. NRS-1366]|uniref:carboxypeptidase M32 n=1 Tax=Brevibacillus sp. NRS-1366 TaxID=3233899 RepID=UPI003D249E22
MMIHSTVEQFKQLDRRISHYQDIVSLINWDAAVTAPRKGIPLMAEAKGTLAAELFQLTTSEQMKNCLEALSDPLVWEQLDALTQATIRQYRRRMDKTAAVPVKLYEQYVVHAAKTQLIWEEAKEKNSFALYHPALARMVELAIELGQAYEVGDHPYDGFLDQYEPGLTVKALDPLFSRLQSATGELLGRIGQARKSFAEDVFLQSYPVARQRELIRVLLTKLGYDWDAGRVDESAHAFAAAMNTGDVRVAVRIVEHDLRRAIFSTIHECGHAFYELGIDPALEGSVLRGTASMAIDESQSRYWENFIGRSPEFWHFFLREVKKLFGSQLEALTPEDVYNSINQVQPGAIRVGSDEVTYNLHIIVRYELEKALLTGEITVKELPGLWNEQMQSHLGVTPETDAQGVLQDSHWACGEFGYFPSYALGNMYAAQFHHTLKQQKPKLGEGIKQGDFGSIREWFAQNVHRHGRLYTPSEIIERVTGEALNTEYLIRYLEQKYTGIYQM